MKRANIVCSIIVIVIAVLWFSQSTQLPEPLTNEPIGPSFIPKVLSICLFLLGMLLFLQSFRIEEETPAGSIVPPFMIMLLMGAYYGLFHIVGFFIATPVMIICFLLYAKERKPVYLIATPIGITLFIYVTFNQLLNVSLPAGMVNL